MALLALVVGLLALLGPSAAEVIGCGGFVEASADLLRHRGPDDPKLDYSHIKVELQTLEGLVKYRTECSPNGYYFIPVYDKGTFKVKVHGPEGWSFAPPEATVVVDQECAAGKDINFQYTGFAVKGKVSGAAGGPSCSAPSSGGPAGVAVTLAPSQGGAKQLLTETAAGGTYAFQNLLPGSYKVSAKHPTWTIRGGPVEVHLGWGNAEVPEPFEVAGYDLSGSVTSEGIPVVGVQFFLYSDTVKSVACPKPSEPGPLKGSKALCQVLSGEDGKFVFSPVPCGKYTVVPLYRGDQTVFDVSPASAEVSVGHGSAKVATTFHITGFSIAGTVINELGDPVEGARVVVNGQDRTKTGPDGKYILDKVSSSEKYQVEAFKEHYVFSVLRDYKILPSMRTLPPLVVQSYFLCGSVTPDEAHYRGKEREVKLQGPDGPKTTLADSSTGWYCFTVPPGKYTVSVTSSPEEKAQGLVFAPESIAVELRGRPTLDVSFTQAKVSISGRVLCLSPPCGNQVSVTLKPNGLHLPLMTEALQPNDPQGKFTFENLTPGKYTLTVTYKGDSADFCWFEKEQAVEVGLEDLENVEFKQKGYLTEILSTHGGVKGVLKGGKGSLEVPIERGKQSVCLEGPGVWELSYGEGCVKFEKEKYRFDTKAMPAKPVVLQASAYKVPGSVKVKAAMLPDEVNDLATSFQVSIQSGDQTNLQVTPVKLVTRAEKVTGTAVYEYSAWVPPGSSLTVTPRHEVLLFYPRIRSAPIPGLESQACPPPVPAFDGRPGLFIEGTVSPPEAGVSVSVSFGSDSRAAGQQKGAIAGTAVTGTDGRYKIGPLYDDAEYTSSASKAGFHFRPLKGSDKWSFEGQRLGSISVNVEPGRQAEEPLPPVLLSLSGEEGYRRNAVTERRKFKGSELFPGTFYLRPFLKEYQFEPGTLEIQVASGEDVSVRFKAHRTSYSVYGVVTLLAGEKAQGVTVEARSSSGLYEEASTDASGKFRLQGLVPGTTYKIKVKTDRGRVERSTPSEILLDMLEKDQEALEFLVFEQPSRCTLTGSTQGAEEWRSHVTVEIASVDSPGRVERAVNVPFSQFFEIGGLPRGRYLVRLAFSLPSRTHEFKSEAVEVDLTTSACQAHVGPLTFRVKERHDKLEPAAPPVLPVLVAVAAVLVFANFSRIQQGFSSSAPAVEGGGWGVPASTTGTSGKTTPVRRRSRVSQTY